ncbi:hypothetical protein ACIBG8_53655 [Nonomuraea sp. NPDC050556]|uniref:hypothetical protein n=1 Tax=Nonomuraea sp. NPDC050556 TaxID=3364369 RepID=UPI0037A14022
MARTARRDDPIARCWPVDRYELRCERRGAPPTAERVHFAQYAVAAARRLYDAQWVTRARVVRLADGVVILDLSHGAELPVELPEAAW